MDAPARAVVVAAHPDDADFGTAGTVARWSDAGATVTLICVTDGDSGGFDDSVPRDQIAGIRQAEQRTAAAAVGVSDVVFLGRPDGFVEVDRSLRRDLARELRRLRPEVVVTHSPERDYARVFMYHPDHLATGAATLAAVYPDARNRFAFPELLDEGLEPWEVPAVWLMGDPIRDHAVDVTDVLDRKLAAVRAHVSQMPGVDDDPGPVLRTEMAAYAREVGLPEGRYAEAFRVLDTR